MLRVLHDLPLETAHRLGRALPGAEFERIDLARPTQAKGDALIVGPAVQRDLGLLDDLDAIGVTWVHVAGTAVDHLPLHLMGGVKLTCGRGTSAIPISEYVLAAMLSFEKRLDDMWLDRPPEQWAHARLGGLNGRKLLIVGLGEVGTAVAARARAFGMEVVGTRRHSTRGTTIAGVRVESDFSQWLPWADHCVISAPATAATHGLFDEAAFGQMKPGLHLVNVARGVLVDQQALRAALDAEIVSLATLDVCEPEPLPAGHWLYSHPRVRLSAHIAWCSPEGFERIEDLIISNVQRFAAHEPLLGLVDSGEGY